MHGGPGCSGARRDTLARILLRVLLRWVLLRWVPLRCVLLRRVLLRRVMAVLEDMLLFDTQRCSRKEREQHTDRTAR